MERNDKDSTKEDEPKITYRGIKAMPFVIGNETFEKLGTTGTQNNLLVYLTTVFNMKSITATTLVNIFGGTTNLATLLGAFLCDTYFGRYKTLGFASIASFLGMLMLTLTAAIPILHPPHCVDKDSGECSGATPWQMTFLISGLGLLVVGAGGIRPCNLAFGADQFNPNTESGKRNISSFFNWYYFTFTFAMMVSLTFIVYVQSDVSWAWGLAIPAFMMLMSCLLFFMGSKLYVKIKPEGSPLTGAVQVIVAAFKKRRLVIPEQPWQSLYNYIPTNSINSKLPYTDQFRFLAKAAIMTPEDKIDPDGLSAAPWSLCSMQQIEQVKCLVRVIPIWVAGFLYSIALVQQQTYVVFQALQSDRRFGNTDFKIPAASYFVFNMLALTVWIPLYDRIIVPFLQRFTKKEDGMGITLLQKMGTGMVISIIMTLVSAIVEQRRRNFALSNPIAVEEGRGAISSSSAMWLVPQLTLAGISEAFTVIAYVEFYYKQFPENMRSIGGSLTFVGAAVSNYLNSFLLSIVHHITKGAPTGDWLPEDLNKGRLDYFYYLVAGLGVLNLGFFVICASKYKYKGSSDTHASQVAMEDLKSEKTLV
ncbi:protein NRT1/ PTR FAMILY 2.11-like isoform X2 [Tripterygium wilfordii]|uniref:protein NRT1/ PTR FAMILY 2.11-like isoform X2 n=1 Tax=Tripterygium wilfordii TaxID=458696 RepID=UPI0018F85B00|nr:protein NRT1/ PTR FAMILY 2.11-like isoform X2 [Tripterygium wilfordii]